MKKTVTDIQFNGLDFSIGTMEELKLGVPVKIELEIIPELILADAGDGTWSYIASVKSVRASSESDDVNCLPKTNRFIGLDIS